MAGLWRGGLGWVGGFVVGWSGVWVLGLGSLGGGWRVEGWWRRAWMEGVGGWRVGCARGVGGRGWREVGGWSVDGGWRAGGGGRGWREVGGWRLDGGWMEGGGLVRGWREVGGWRLDGGVDGGWRAGGGWREVGGWRVGWMEGRWGVDGGLVGLVDGGWMEGLAGWRAGWRGWCGWSGGGRRAGWRDCWWMEGWMEGVAVAAGLDGGLRRAGGWRVGWRGSGMDGGMGFLNRTEPNRKKNRPEPREPKPSQNPSEKPKRTETNRGFTVKPGKILNASQSPAKLYTNTRPLGLQEGTVSPLISQSHEGLTAKKGSFRTPRRRRRGGGREESKVSVGLYRGLCFIGFDHRNWGLSFFGGVLSLQFAGLGLGCCKVLTCIPVGFKCLPSLGFPKLDLVVADSIQSTKQVPRGSFELESVLLRCAGLAKLQGYFLSAGLFLDSGKFTKHRADVDRFNLGILSRGLGYLNPCSAPGFGELVVLNQEGCQGSCTN